MTLKEFFVGNPKVKIKFYSDTHKYFVEDEQIPNVTNIVKLLTDSQPLVIWSGNCSADKFDSLVEVGKNMTRYKRKKSISKSKQLIETHWKRQAILDQMFTTTSKDILRPKLSLKYTTSK